MWSKSNATKLKNEPLGKREKQQQHIKNEKFNEANVKTDSGIVSDVSQSYELFPKENSDDDIQPLVNNPKETKLSSTVNIDDDSGCISELDINTKDISKQFPKKEYDWRFNFQQDEYGDTNLHLAILCGYVEEAKRLIENCPESNLLDIQNYDGQSALHLAVLTNQCEIIESLMIAKANGELLDYDGNTAIHLACYNGFLDCLNTLSKHLTLSKMLDIINYDGLACIHIATIADHLNILKFVVDRSKNVNITDYKSGFTALHFAKALNRKNLIEYLLEKVDSSIESYAGRLAYEIDDDYDYDDDEDEDDEEESGDLVNSMSVLQLPINNSVKC